jgi:hypothetical protein
MMAYKGGPGFSPSSPVSLPLRLSPNERAGNKYTYKAKKSFTVKTLAFNDQCSNQRTVFGILPVERS